MNDKPTGGGAFPAHKNALDPAGPMGGMTLRDYFAAKALQGLLALPEEWSPWLRRDGNGSTWQWEAAATAYKLDDAMLRAREAS